MINRKRVLLISISLITFALLYLIATWLLLTEKGHTHSGSSPIQLLKNKTYVFDGYKSNKGSDSIRLQSSPFGEVNIAFDSVAFKAMDYPVIEVDLNHLQNNYSLYLVWKVRGDDQAYETNLLHINGRSANLLNRNTGWKGEIEQIGLSIRPHNHLGIKKKFDYELDINSVLLTQPGVLSNFSLIYHYWTNYSPWDYSSINHLKAVSLLPVYAKLPVFLGIYLAITILIFTCFHAGIHSFLALMISVWIFYDGIFLLNLKENAVWAYQTQHDEMRLPDKDILNIAMEVKSRMGEEKSTVGELKTRKVYILAADKYTLFRLMYHLLPVNSSFAANLASVKPGDFILQINDLFQGENLIKNIPEKYHVNSVQKTDFFSLLEVTEK